jgi:formylglycine-generating enzyme required for sulfatase activity
MRPRILISIFILLIGDKLCAQRTAHPEFLMKYYFTANEPVKQSVVPSASIREHSAMRFFNFQCFPSPKFAINGKENAPPYLEYQSTPQLGFDTIFPIEERLACGPFMSASTEITNAEYKEFLIDSEWMKLNGYTISQLYPDTLVWKDIPANAERSSVKNPFRNYYFQSTNFPNYPVVGISQLQATAFCAWLKTKIEQNPSEPYQQWLSALNNEGLTFEIDLPTTAEWMYLYKQAVEIPFETRRNVKGKKKDEELPQRLSGILFSKPNTGNALLDFVFNRTASVQPVVYQGIFTNRGYQISEIQNANLSRPMPVKAMPDKSYGQIAHLLGNVSEWTSTSAYGHLYNSNTTILNTNGQLIPNPYQQVNVFDLRGYLVDETALRGHFAIKGGSWAQEFHYLDPSALQFMQSNHSSNYVGFRPVIRFYKK